MRKSLRELFSASLFHSHRAKVPVSAEALEDRRLLTTYTLSTIPFNFTNGSNSAAGLFLDQSGNLFGTTSNGGLHGFGEVFEIVHGTRTITPVAFFDGDDNGKGPQAPVIVDSLGDIFGTTITGGVNHDGTVFEIPHGTSTINDIVSFGGGTDGAQPLGGLVRDANGNLFGTTSTAGLNSDGTEFEIPGGTGALITIPFDNINGATPTGSLLLDPSGAIYGTASAGGENVNPPRVFEQGVVFSAGGGLSSVAIFGRDGMGDSPEGGVIEDAQGNLYGVTDDLTHNGGDGTVFEIAKNSGVITTLVTFTGDNGEHPQAGLIMDANGNLFGTTSGSDIQNGIDGTVFEIVKGSGAVTTLATFNGANGLEPESNLVMDANGNLFGTTLGGGPSNVNPGGDGVVFELSPVAPLGAATHLAFMTSPAAAAPNQTFASAVTVAVEDSSNNIVTGNNSNVVLTLNGASGATLGGATAAAAVNGIATFSNLLITQAASNVSLTASDGALTSATSTAFNVTAPIVNTSSVLPVIASSNLPASFISSAALHSTLKITLDNTSAKAQKITKVKVFLSADPLLDISTDKLVTTFSAGITINAKKSVGVSIPITKLPPNVVAGAYYLIVQSTDSAGHTSAIASHTRIHVAAPFVALTETFTTTLPAIIASASSLKAAANFTIANHGNIPSNGKTRISITASTIRNVPGVPIATSSPPITITPGKPVKATIPITKFPALTPGTYFLVATVTDPSGKHTTVATAGKPIKVIAKKSK